MPAAKNFVIFNPDLHLSGYYNNLVKGGMKKIDARKRVARALVRVFFKDLYSVVHSDHTNAVEEKEEGNDMASGSSRRDTEIS